MVLDFDWSLVEENSDTWVLQQLGAAHIFQRLLAQSEGSRKLRQSAPSNGRVKSYDGVNHAELPWTQLMDSALHAVHTELKASQEDVLRAIRSTPFHADLIEVRSSAALGCMIK